jgi:methyl-accepting chemotaxis protein
MKQRVEKLTLTERVTTWIGSRASLIIHTIIFIAFFLAVAFKLLTFETMLLILTTAVSLEAIYLAIFIQMTVNRNTQSLREIQEDIGEIQEDVEEMSEDIDEIQEDVEELNEEEEEQIKKASTARSKATEAELLEKLSQDVARLLTDLEALKKGK